MVKTQNTLFVDSLVPLDSQQIPSIQFCDFRAPFLHSYHSCSPCLTMASTANAASASAERPSYQYGRPSAAAARSAAAAAPSTQQVLAGAVRSSQPFRRYGVGDRVLICNHAARWSNLVNRHGFPDGQGDNAEERKGPYIYALATVKRIHFGENQQYYTVQRADPGGEQRADAGKSSASVRLLISQVGWITLEFILHYVCVLSAKFDEIFYMRQFQQLQEYPSCRIFTVSYLCVT